MNEAAETLEQMKRADKLVRLSFHKNGPKSYRRGQGALLRALLDHDGATQRELVEVLGLSRRELKDVVKKAERNGYVTIGEVEEPRTYTVALTDCGRGVAQKRADANDRAAEDIASCLDADELAQLRAISEKLIDSAEQKGVRDQNKGRRSRRARRQRCAC